MSSKNLSRPAPLWPRLRNDGHAGGIDQKQLMQLAERLGRMSSGELARLVRNNPALAEEWLAAFRFERTRAEQEANSWDAAAELVLQMRSPLEALPRDRRA